MRTVRLHDTKTGALKELTPRDGGKVGIYACGPTVYGRIHVGNARPFVVFSLLKRFLAHEGYDPVLVANITDINDKIYDAARPAGRPSGELAAEMTDHYIADTERLALGRPDHEPRATLMIDEIVALIGDLIERDHAYVADGDVYFRVRSLPEYGELSHRDVDQMDQGEGLEGSARKEDPLDFALWKARKPMEDTWWSAPWGEGRPGWHIECSAMAEATLGAPFEIHGGGNDLIFPHHENEAAQTLAARGRELAQIWMHNGMLELGGKMSKSVGNIRGLADVLDEFGRDALVMFFNEAHYRQPLAFTPEKLGGRRAARGGDPQRGPSARARPVAGSARAAPRGVLRRARGRLQHAAGARRAGGVGARGERLCRAGRGRGPARDARRARAREPAGARGRRARRGAGAGRGPRDGARRARLRRGRPAARRAARARLGGARRRRRARAGADRAVIVYGRNAVREAIRGPREVSAVWATKGAAREFAGARPASADEIAQRCGSDGHQGVCAEVSAYRYADGAELLRAEAPVLVALDEITDPQNLGAVCRTAECTGATGVILPERRSAEVTAAVCKASAGAVEHLAIARVRNLADFLADAKGAGCWTYGAAAGARTGYRDVDWRGGVVLVLGAEGRGLRPRVAAACDDLVSLPLRGRIDSLNVSATAAVLLYQILQTRLDAST